MKCPDPIGRSFSPASILALLLACPAALLGQSHETVETLEVAQGFEIVRPAVGDAAGARNKFPFSHGFGSGAPVALHGGRVLMIYRHTTESRLESAISRDGGKTWVGGGVVARNRFPEVTIGRPAAVRTRAGTIWVFYYGYIRYDPLQPRNSKSDIWAVRSDDGGRTWQDHRRIWEGYAGMLNGAIETRSGNILLPFCYPGAPSRWLSGCVVSQDHGKTWSFSGGIDIGAEADRDRRSDRLDGGSMDPAVVELKDGRVWMLLRTITGKLWQSFSTDGGLNWGRPTQTTVSCGGPMYVTRLASGRVALVWNQADSSAVPKYGYPHGFDEASIALSDDEGETWQRPVVFARARRVCHSLLLETAPGQLLITMPSRSLVLRTTEKVLITRPEAAEALPLSPQGQDPRRLTCVALGDSATARLTVDGEPLRNYASILESRLAGEGTIPRVVNLGVPGDTTADARHRLTGDVISLRPDIVIVQFGVNDAAVDVWKRPPATAPRIPLADYEENLRTIVAQLKGIGTEVVLMTPNPMRWTDELRRLYSKSPYDPSDPDGLNTIIREYVKAVRRIAASQEVILVDVFSAFSDFPKTHGGEVDDLMMDGLHPNARGHEFIADLIIERLNAPVR